MVHVSFGIKAINNLAFRLRSPAPTPFPQPVLSSALQAIRAWWQSQPQAAVPGVPRAMLRGSRLQRAAREPGMERFPIPYPTIQREAAGQEP